MDPSVNRPQLPSHQELSMIKEYLLLPWSFQYLNVMPVTLGKVRLKHLIPILRSFTAQWIRHPENGPVFVPNFAGGGFK
ncbi:hypothetical protein [Paenibacillus larvae]|uniref:hypothetical protein n=1 Tax=Paenibacillus larvae TaxID=1464 RepID=UPI00288F9F63|nr:hypothetical protein [Paenibacillus larvae]MDT2191341.1 hypothetical protein [Paenibacillus larvae]